MKKKLRTIQPAHVSEKFTVEEAMAAWRKVEAEAAARPKRARGARVVTPATSGDRAEIAADRERE